MAMLGAPCAKESSQMEEIVQGTRSKSDEAWSFVRRVKLIRENLLGASPEPATDTVKSPPPAIGTLFTLEDALRTTHAAFDALNAELPQIEKCLGL